LIVPSKPFFRLVRGEDLLPRQSFITTSSLPSAALIPGSSSFVLKRSHNLSSGTTERPAVLMFSARDQLDAARRNLGQE